MEGTYSEGKDARLHSSRSMWIDSYSTMQMHRELGRDSAAGDEDDNQPAHQTLVEGRAC